MTLRTLLAGCALVSAIGAPVQAAEFVNGGLENGLTGYDASGIVEVLTSADPAVGATYDPIEGDHLARLTAGPDPAFYTVLSQTFTVDVTSILSGYAAFLAFDDYNDDAYVRVYDPSSEQLLFVSSVAAVLESGGATPWTFFSSGPLLSGVEYVFEAGVRNAGEPAPASFNSQLLVDGVTVTEAPTALVPEPGSWALMILGFLGVGGVMRQRRHLPA